MWKLFTMLSRHFTEVSDHHLLCLPVTLYKSYFTFKIIFQWIICIEFRSLKIEPHNKHAHTHTHAFYTHFIYSCINIFTKIFFSSRHRLYRIIDFECFSFTQMLSNIHITFLTSLLMGWCCSLYTTQFTHQQQI